MGLAAVMQKLKQYRHHHKTETLHDNRYRDVKSFPNEIVTEYWHITYRVQWIHANMKEFRFDFYFFLFLNSLKR